MTRIAAGALARARTNHNASNVVAGALNTAGFSETVGSLRLVSGSSIDLGAGQASKAISTAARALAVGSAAPFWRTTHGGGHLRRQDGSNPVQ